MKSSIFCSLLFSILLTTSSCKMKDELIQKECSSKFHYDEKEASSSHYDEKGASSQYSYGKGASSQYSYGKGASSQYSYGKGASSQYSYGKGKSGSYKGKNNMLMDNQGDYDVIQCSLKREYVEAIKSGSKTYEGRVNTMYFKDYLPGRMVEWSCGSGDRDKVLTKIVSRTCFSSFEEMLDNVGFKKFLPKTRNMTDAINLYHSIPGYQEKVIRKGALALEICVISKSSDQKGEKRESNTSIEDNREKKRQRISQ